MMCSGIRAVRVYEDDGNNAVVLPFSQRFTQSLRAMCMASIMSY